MSKLENVRNAYFAIDKVIFEQPSLKDFLAKTRNYLLQRINHEKRVENFNTQDNDTQRTNP